ncbi:helix-turn-helix transcriptional regulator [Candidatus Gracilibacteria bacterium]|nr:helix-turn-helix transcriptional regulator [Candidatus Gracilibacteria bacterium]
MKTLGQYIRELRDKKDISLRELAKSIDCSAPFVSDIELGKRFPSDDVLADIAKVLGVKKTELEKYDVRSDVQDFKKLSQTDPQYAYAFRQMIDKKINPEDVLKALKKLESK